MEFLLVSLQFYLNYTLTHIHIMKNSNWKRGLYIIYTSINIFIALTKAEDVANITEKFV